MVRTQRGQEHGIQQGLRHFAQRHGLSIAEDHYAQEFGCSNIYSIREGEIIVRNPFGYDYKISAYASEKSDEARLTPLEKELAALTRSAPESDRALC